jgi:hypothetical protein
MSHFEPERRLALDRAYWVDPGRLMAGSYPGEYEPMATRGNIRWLLESGIRTFVSLMEAREENYDDGHLPAYAPIVAEVSRRRGVSCELERFAIHDMSVPSPERVGQILATIERSLARERPVYLHCWGGRGRTGLVAGIYLIQRGLATPENFVEVIERLRVGSAGGGRSPETSEQVDFVRRYVRSA